VRQKKSLRTLRLCVRFFFSSSAPIRQIRVIRVLFRKNLCELCVLRSSFFDLNKTILEIKGGRQFFGNSFIGCGLVIKDLIFVNRMRF
jgi:hypothetical protein